MVKATEGGQVVFTPIRKLEECAGIYSKYGGPEEMKRHIDRLRGDKNLVVKKEKSDIMAFAGVLKTKRLRLKSLPQKSIKKEIKISA